MFSLVSHPLVRATNLREFDHTSLLDRPPDAEALSWLGGLETCSWALMLGGDVSYRALGPSCWSNQIRQPFFS